MDSGRNHRDRAGKKSPGHFPQDIVSVFVLSQTKTHLFEPFFQLFHFAVVYCMRNLCVGSHTQPQLNRAPSVSWLPSFRIFNAIAAPLFSRIQLIKQPFQIFDGLLISPHLLLDFLQLVFVHPRIVNMFEFQDNRVAPLKRLGGCQR